MQAMPMINQPAPVNEAVAPRAARSMGKSTDDKFLPALKEACKECGDDELAGAAMVSQGDSSQQQVLAENGDVAQEQPVTNEKGEPVVADGALTAKAADQVVSVGSPIVEGEDVAQAMSSTGSATAEISEKRSVVASNNQPLNGEMVEERIRVAQGVQENRHQQNVDSRSVETLVESAQNNVASTAVQVGEAQKGITAQVVAAVSEGNGVRQLDIQPMEKVAEVVGNIEAKSAEKSAGSRPVVTDPRFASLLNEPEIGVTLRQQQGGDSSLIAPAVPAMAGSIADVAGEAGNRIGSDGNVVAAPTVESLAVTETLGLPTASTQQADGVTSTAVQPQVVAGEVATTHGSEVSIPLKDGSSLPESRVVQQTIDHLTLHARGESSSVTVKLHPEELGELQLRMVMEGDQLKVHLHAQTQQVQEVLERNFPRLRDALQDQGVTVEDFQVSVDSGDRGDQQSSEQRELADSRQSNRFSSFNQDGELEVEAVISAAAAQADGRGVSLRV